MSRKRKLTPELQERIVALIRMGNYPDVAAAACGVGRATLFEWLQRASGEHPTRGTTPALRAFAEAVETAVAFAEARLVGKVFEFIEGTRNSKRKPGRKVKGRLTVGQVMAVQWTLSRRFPERWAQRPTTAIGISTGGDAADTPETGGVTIEIVHAPPLTDEEESPHNQYPAFAEKFGADVATSKRLR